MSNCLSKEMADVTETNDVAVNTVPKKFGCGKCEKAYTSKKSLWRHKRQKHSKMEEVKTSESMKERGKESSIRHNQEYMNKDMAKRRRRLEKKRECERIRRKQETLEERKQRLIKVMERQRKRRENETIEEKALRLEKVRERKQESRDEEIESSERLKVIFAEMDKHARIVKKMKARRKGQKCQCTKCEGNGWNVQLQERFASPGDEIHFHFIDNNEDNIDNLLKEKAEIKETIRNKLLNGEDVSELTTKRNSISRKINNMSFPMPSAELDPVKELQNIKTIQDDIKVKLQELIDKRNILKQFKLC